MADASLYLSLILIGFLLPLFKFLLEAFFNIKLKELIWDKVKKITPRKLNLHGIFSSEHSNEKSNYNLLKWSTCELAILIILQLHPLQLLIMLGGHELLKRCLLRSCLLRSLTQPQP